MPDQPVPSTKTQDDDAADVANFGVVCAALTNYRTSATKSVDRLRRNAKRAFGLSGLLATSYSATFESHIKKLAEAIELNGEFSDGVLSEAVYAPCCPDDIEEQDDIPTPKNLDIDAEVATWRSTLHSLVREWSVEGKTERDACFKPILDELRLRLPVNSENRNKQLVLVPGCALGRLPLEITSLGYATSGNEFSYHMLLTLHFLLAKTSHEDPIMVSPFIDQPCNHKRHEDQVRKVQVPDVTPQELIEMAEEGYDAAASAAARSEARAAAEAEEVARGGEDDEEQEGEEGEEGEEEGEEGEEEEAEGEEEEEEEEEEGGADFEVVAGEFPGVYLSGDDAREGR
jgi:hypothetical protein